MILRTLKLSKSIIPIISEGFDFAMISDHYHPWISQTGQIPFVWSTIRDISHVTERLPTVTGVKCPTFRTHPAIIAQAAAAACIPMKM